MLWNMKLNKEWTTSQCLTCAPQICQDKIRRTMCSCFGKTVFFKDAFGRIVCPILGTVISAGQLKWIGGFEEGLQGE